MARSVKKGPYCEEKLLKKIEAMNETGKKQVIKTWSMPFAWILCYIYWHAG